MLTKEFVLAGKATFTIEPSAEFVNEHKDSKPHYTYKVKFSKGREKKDKPGEYWPDAYWVTLLAGPDNTKDYVPLGKLIPETGKVNLTSNSKFKDNTWPVIMIRRVMARLWAGQGGEIEKVGWKVHHEGHCGRCNRPLTVPLSIEMGIGPECAKRVFGRRYAA